MNTFFFILLSFVGLLTWIASDSSNKEKDRQYRCFELTKEKTCFNPKGEK